MMPTTLNACPSLLPARLQEAEERRKAEAEAEAQRIAWQEELKRLEAE